MKRSVPLDKVEAYIGHRIGEGETIEYEGQTWKVFMYRRNLNLVLLESPDKSAGPEEDVEYWPILDS